MADQTPNLNIGVGVPPVFVGDGSGSPPPPPPKLGGSPPATPPPPAPGGGGSPLPPLPGIGSGLAQIGGGRAPLPPPVVPAKKRGKGKVIGGILALVVLMGGLGTGLYLIGQQTIFKERAAGALPSSCDNGGSFTTGSGKKYCFVLNNTGGNTANIKTIADATATCQLYGKLATFLDGETKQDVLDVISQFSQDKSLLYQGLINEGNPDDGAYFADSCNQFTTHFGNNDTTLYWGDSEPAGNLNCSASLLSFGRSHDGLINDTADGNGRGAVCELAAVPTATPTTPPTATCEQYKVLRNGAEIQLTDIHLGDTIVFRGFSTTQVSKLRFTLSKNGVAQTPVEENATLVSGSYQADYEVTISEATSYSVNIVPIP